MIYKYLINNYEYYLKITEKITSSIEKNMGISITRIDLLIITILLSSLDVTKLDAMPRGIIVAHGYSTASSISNVVNRLLSKKVFEGFDMELDITSKEIAYQIIEYCKTKVNSQGVIILVDMGSLEQLPTLLMNNLDVPVGLINNVSTNLALNVGEQIVSEKSMDTIVKNAKKSFKLESYSLYPNLMKEKVLLTVCRTGIGTAKRICNLLEESLQPITTIKIYPIEFNELYAEKWQKKREKEEIVAVVGTEKIDFNDIPYFSLEDLIVNSSIDEIINLLNPDLNENKRSQIHDRLVRNFSLERVLDNLTILDSKRVISVTYDFIENYEVITQKKLSNAKKISLCVHVSCLIERLIRNDPIKTYTGINTSSFFKEEGIENIKKAVSGIEKQYNVIIPFTELKYIFDIIHGKVEYTNQINEF